MVVMETEMEPTGDDDVSLGPKLEMIEDVLPDTMEPEDASRDVAV